MDIKEVIQTIYRGRAVLFVGAGFSRGAIGFKGELPVAEELKNIIYKSMGKPNDSQKNLSVVADYFFKEYCKHNPKALEDFIKLMKDTFTVTEPQDYHVTLASLPWKRIYTTNYDDVIEKAAKNKKHGKRIECKDLEDLSRVQEEYYCLHINGRVANLNQETLNKSFKLTSSSYMNPETPIDTLWKRVFKDDIEISSLIVFIGYSLYDADIEKILFQHNSSIKNKTIFIQNEDIDEMDRHKFEKYGKVYPIGVQGFASLIEQPPIPVNIEEEISLQCFCELKLIEKTLEPIRDAEIDKFLIQGYITDERIQDETIREPSKAPFLIRRSKIEEALESIKNSETKILVVTGDIGNGKTIFLKQLSIKLAINRQVFTLEQRGDEFDIKRDIDNIVKLNKNSIIIIDSYTRYPWILEYIKQKPYNELIFIFAARTYDYYRNLQENDYLQSAKQIDIDTLDDGELEYFYDIIEYIGGWYLSKDSKAKHNSKNQKMRILSQDCKKELSLILVKVLESETMKNKINKLLDNLFNSPINKKQVFAICLLNYMDIPISISLLEEILGEHDLAIYENENLKHLVNLNLINKDNEISMKSPILSFLILKTYFAKENTQYFLEILRRLMEWVSYNVPFLNEIRKNLLRFNFIERLLVVEGKIGRIQKYYEDLKKEFKQLLNDPQYWLQYAMCFIMYNDLDKAQRMLNTAYDKADSDYDKTKIDNQQARLHLKKASKADTNIKEAITLFSQADKLLTKQNNDSMHKYKIMMDYKEFFDARSKSFNQEQRNQIIACCKKQLNTLNSITAKERFKEWKIYEECRDMLEEFVRNFTYKNPT